MKGRLLYVIGVPLVTLGLCVLSYYMGLTRSQKVCEGAQVDAPVDPKEHEGGDQLTFFQALKEPEKAEPELAPTVAPRTKTFESKPVTQGVYVQVSAFKDIGKAHEMVDDLKNRGFPATVMAKKDKRQELHRVLVGPYESKDTAQKGVDELKGAGFSSTFVARIP